MRTENSETNPSWGVWCWCWSGSRYWLLVIGGCTPSIASANAASCCSAETRHGDRNGFELLVVVGARRRVAIDDQTSCGRWTMTSSVLDLGSTMLSSADLLPVALSPQQWHTDKHRPLRLQILNKIARRLTKPPKTTTEEWDARLETTVKELELKLYQGASSFESYSDLETLKSRLDQIALQCAAKNVSSFTLHLHHAPRFIGSYCRRETNALPPPRLPPCSPVRRRFIVLPSPRVPRLRRRRLSCRTLYLFALTVSILKCWGVARAAPSRRTQTVKPSNIGPAVRRRPRPVGSRGPRMGRTPVPFFRRPPPPPRLVCTSSSSSSTQWRNGAHHHPTHNHPPLSKQHISSDDI